MRRRFAMLSTLAVLALTLCLAWREPCLAAEGTSPENVDGISSVEDVEGNSLPESSPPAPLIEPRSSRTWVIDEAGLISEEEEEKLNERCMELYDTYGVLVAIVTVDDFGGGDILQWQKQVFMENPFGVRARDGIMLAVSMADRDWGIQTVGEGQRVFNTYGREKIGTIVLESLSDGEYYDAFADFVELSGKFLKEAEKGEPYSSDHPYKKGMPIWIIVVISFVMSLAVSLAIVTGWKRGMNTQVRQNEAGQYLKSGSFHLTRSSDIFLYHTVSRTPIPKHDDTSSSGGGSSSMSSTSSGTSGKF